MNQIFSMSHLLNIGLTLPFVDRSQRKKEEDADSEDSRNQEYGDAENPESSSRLRRSSFVSEGPDWNQEISGSGCEKGPSSDSRTLGGSGNNYEVPQRMTEEKIGGGGRSSSRQRTPSAARSSASLSSRHSSTNRDRSLDKKSSDEDSRSSWTDLQGKDDIRDYAIRLRLEARRGKSKKAETGLFNLGNTCYINSIVQSLSNCQPLAEYFLSRRYVQHINKNKLGSKGKIASSFSALLHELHSEKSRALKPRQFVDTVRGATNMFSAGLQHDAQEFLVVLLDALHENLDQAKRKVPLEQQNLMIENRNLVDAARRSWEFEGRKSRSEIHNLFKGQMISSVWCSVCKTESYTFDCFTQITLELPIGVDKCSLLECLRSHLQEETMTGDAQWNCPTCNQLRNATKKIDFWKLPQLLIIHLNRFEVGKKGGHQKMNTKVEYPLRDLSMQIFLHSQADRVSSDFRLCSVTNHEGNIMGGHYMASCYNIAMKTWLQYNDDQVTSISERDVKSDAETAYILFYAKTG